MIESNSHILITEVLNLDWNLSTTKDSVRQDASLRAFLPNTDAMIPPNGKQDNWTGLHAQPNCCTIEPSGQAP